MYPERVILGSENYPKEIGFRWPMVERTPYVIGDFTWIAFDYLEGAGTLDAFGSSNPITDENYTAGTFTSYQGRATAIIRSGYESGSCTLTVSSDEFETVRAVIEVK